MSGADREPEPPTRPGRGAWDLEWKGWWGAEPPYHAPVFVLTHHPRAQTVNQYLAAGHIDELRLHVAPVVLGACERLFDGVADVDLEPLDVSGTDLVTHVSYRVVRA
jgi:hypothetical protein